MALPQSRPDWAPSSATPQQRGLDSQPAVAMPSPARALQQLLDERTQAAPDVARWSRRRQLAFIVTTSCALWLAILAVAGQAMRAIA